jgi:hypothetical protein
MRAHNVDLSGVFAPRDALWRSGRPSARSRGKAFARAALGAKSTRPLTARCDRYHEESVRSDRKYGGRADEPLTPPAVTRRERDEWQPNVKRGARLWVGGALPSRRIGCRTALRRQAASWTAVYSPPLARSRTRGARATGLPSPGRRAFATNGERQMESSGTGQCAPRHLRSGQ